MFWNAKNSILSDGVSCVGVTDLPAQAKDCSSGRRNQALFVVNWNKKELATGKFFFRVGVTDLSV